jgi:hypothetical protein
MDDPKDHPRTQMSLLARMRPEIQTQLNLNQEQRERLVKYLAELLLEAIERRRPESEASDE